MPNSNGAAVASDELTPSNNVWLSRMIARLELRLAGLFLAGVFLIVLANVVGRTMGRPLIWADELAIYGMIWAAFIGASAGLSAGEHIAITLIPDALQSHRHVLMRCVDYGLLVLLAAQAVITWNWFDPIGYFSASSPQEYSAQTFNFMHQEPTTTIGIGKVWVWLVLPLFNVTALIHVGSRLVAGVRA